VDLALLGELLHGATGDAGVDLASLKLDTATLKRLGVEGWLSNWRIEFDGRLSAEISGYAPTSRVKHRTVVNVPKADPKVLLGCEMRDLFKVPKGYWYCGTDAAALENRTLSHYTFKFDGGKFARMQTEGDPHSFNAFAFFPHLHDKFDINDQENKENPDFKTWRNKAKTGAYLLAFGGGAAKLAGTSKGGAVLSIKRELGVPVRFVGTGEKVEDFAYFDPISFVSGLVGE